MRKNPATITAFILLIILLSILVYPKEMILAPEVELTVFYENNQLAKNVEVKRSWDSYLNERWKVNSAFTNENGKVRFNSVKKRIPIILERLNYYLAFIHMHENNSNVGSFTARDTQNHFVWGSVDYIDNDCCPTKIVMTKQSLELTNTLFGFGELVSE